MSNLPILKYKCNTKPFLVVRQITKISQYTVYASTCIYMYMYLYL